MSAVEFVATAPHSEWLDPKQSPPPLSCKMLLLTMEGTAVIGHWQDYGYDAWAPLPKKPQWLQRKQLERHGAR